VGLKIKLLAELYNSSSPLEAKFITRFIIGRLRLGINAPTVTEALALHFVPEFLKKPENKELLEREYGPLKKEEEIKQKARMFLKEKIEQKYFLYSDLGEISSILWKEGLKGLDKVKVELFTPIKPALAERLPTYEEILEKLGGKCAVEAKYDGFRLQIHKQEDKVKIFSRRQEEITHMLPDIVEAIKKTKPKNFIIEGEALAYDKRTKENLRFQMTIQRKRKYDIPEISKKLPLRLYVFDVIYFEGKETWEQTFLERRALIEKNFNISDIFQPTEMKIVSTKKEMQEFFNKTTGKGYEGIMAKDLSAPYVPGARKFAWIKFKKSYQEGIQDTFDVVIIGFYKGKGKRKGVVGSLLTATYNDKTGEYETIAKVSTGLSDEQLSELYGKLSSHILKNKPPYYIVSKELEPDLYVEPFMVIEIASDEITESPWHSCALKLNSNKKGLALRFPRVIRVREKKPEDATSSKEVYGLYLMSKGERG
jgi:DNA ligase-1